MSIKKTLLVLVLLVFMNIPLGFCDIPIYDGFNNLTINAGIWNNVSSTWNNASENGNELVLNSTGAGSALLISRFNYSLTSNTTRIKVTQHSSDGGFKLSATYGIGANYPQWDIYAEQNYYNFHPISNTQLSAQKVNSGIASTMATSPTLTVPYWMQMRINSTGEIFFEYSQDNISWITLYHEPWGLGTDLNTPYFVFLTTYNTASTGEMHVDDFWLSNNLITNYKPNIQFVSPTLSNGSTNNTGSIVINTTVSDLNINDNLTSFVDFNRSLLHWWTFNNGFNDSIGHSNGNMQGNNTNNFTLGKFGNALYTDRLNKSFLDIGTDDVSYSTNLSIELWVKPNINQEFCYDAGLNYGNYGVLASVNDFWASTDWSWQLRYGAPVGCRLGWQVNLVGGGIWVQMPTNLSTTNYTYLTLTFSNGTTLRMYANTILMNETIVAPTSIHTNPSNKILIGCDGWCNSGTLYSGAIDDVRFWNRVLSIDEMKSSYDARNNPINITFGNLNSGFYNFTSYIQDSFGAINNTETRYINQNFTLLVTNSVNFTFITPAISETQIYQSSQTQHISINVSDYDGNISGVIVGISFLGVEFNYSMSNNTNNTNDWFYDFKTGVPGAYTVSHFYATDNASGTNFTTTSLSFVVVPVAAGKGTVDNSIPTPTPLKGINTTSPISPFNSFVANLKNPFEGANNLSDVGMMSLNYAKALPDTQKYLAFGVLFLFFIRKEAQKREKK